MTLVVQTVLLLALAVSAPVQLRLLQSPAPSTPPAISAPAVQPQPHQMRVGPNLVTNPTFAGTTSWALSAGATYDAGVSRSQDGSGAIRFPLHGRLDAGPSIPVTPGKTYTFAAYILTTTWPPGTMGLYIPGGETAAAGNSAPSLWEEIAMIVTPTGDTVSMSLVFARLLTDSGVGDVWLDEVYFGEGVGFGSPPAAKVPFDGAAVAVDALGNLSVKRGSAFEPFFPLCLYHDDRRPNALKVLSDQGWNCTAWGYWNDMAPAAAATSAFNPHGMMVGQGIGQTMNEGGYSWTPDGHCAGEQLCIDTWIQRLKATGFYETHVLWWYWDNEGVWDQWGKQMTAANQWKSRDVNAAGQRLHPFYGLQGMPNAARMYHDPNGTTCCDMTGTYVDQLLTGGAGLGGSHEILLNAQGQTFPVVIAQVNIAHAWAGPGQFRNYVYKMLARGARGIGVWRDCYLDDCDNFAGPIVEKVAWWPDVPALRKEIDQLGPLLRTPHWTAWHVTHTAPPEVTIGTRDYAGKGHLILSNGSPQAQTFTVTLAGLPYTPTGVVNVLTGASAGQVSGTSFPVTLPASGIGSGTAVLRLDGAGATARSTSE